VNGYARWVQSKTIDLDGPVHYVDFGGPNGAPPMVLVHGLGGSHVNWMGVGHDLAARRRVFALDLVGFGRTPPAGRSARLEVNRTLLDRFVETVAGGRAVLIGNSMGGLLSLMQAAACPKSVEALVLVSAPFPRPRGVPLDREIALAFALYLVPGLGHYVLRRRNTRLTPEEASRELLQLCCVDASRVPPDLFAAHVQMNRLRREMPWMEDAFLQATRSLVGVLARPAKLLSLVDAVRAPTLLIQGDGDRLVPLEAARAIARQRADWRLEVIEGVGHVPQMEAPAGFVEIVSRFVASLERSVTESLAS
jgi:pimeloyl-ACP methyl ester carboxylesterase